MNDDYMSPDLGNKTEKKIVREDARKVNLGLEKTEDSIVEDKRWRVSYLLLTDDPPSENHITIKSPTVPGELEIKSEIVRKNKWLESKWASIRITKTQQLATDFRS